MSDEERVERELKFPCSDLNSLREHLQAAEAEKVSASSLEDNLIFDRNGELASASRLLRLRFDGRGACLTFKGPAAYDGGVKIREEIETAVDKPTEMRAILENLGYEKVQRYQKYREEWRLGGVMVCLDRTPIGDFVEFEGDAAAKLAKRFGLDPQTAERRSYLKIYQDHRELEPTAPEEMVFS
jgi:adenylate cyclase class 2